MYHLEQAEVLLSMRNHVQAAEIAKRLPELSAGQQDGYLHAAFFLARCVSLAKTDGNLSRTQRDDLVESYACAAVERLSQAIDRGYRNRKQMEIDPHLQPLGSRPDFQNVLKRLPAPG
jgi:hypothetical protein